MRKRRVFLVNEMNIGIIMRVINCYQELFFANGRVSVGVYDEKKFPGLWYVEFKAGDRRYNQIFKYLLKNGNYDLIGGDFYWEPYFYDGDEY